MLRNCFIIAIVGFFFISCNEKSETGVNIEGLTVNMMEDPVGVMPEKIRFGWKLVSEAYNLTQGSYQIVVAPSEEELENDEFIWDSGKVSSSQSQHVTYEGKDLQAGKEYFWKVRSWIKDEHKVSVWSEPETFFTAPSSEDFQAEWIGAITREKSNLPESRDFHTPTIKKEKRQELIDAVDSLATRSIMLRKEFKPEKDIKNAQVFISGLGHYELTINGEKIGNSEFAPLWSDYDKTVFYNIYDVTKLLQEENAIGVMLGNGMYNVIGERYSKFYVSFGPPTLFFNLHVEYEDGSTQVVKSDSSWKYDKSPITFNTIFGGEDYDARLEQEGWDKPGFDTEHWKSVVVQEAPKGELRTQTAPPVKIEKEYKVQKINEPEEDIYVLDMGQNLSGFPKIKVKGEKGQKVKFWVGEKLNDDGKIDQGGSGKPYYFEYTLKGDGEEEWQPRFSYYGYQYVQIEGANYQETKNKELPLVTDITSQFVYNSAGEAGSFESSNEIFNQTHLLINNAIKSNFHSVFTDCPHREKLGWLEETHLNGPGLFFNYNLQAMVPKIMQDIADAQRENGLIPNIAPEYIVFGGDFTDSPEWGVAGVVLPWMYYEYYGDSSLIEEYYEVMKAYVDYLTKTAENGIVDHGLGDWYDFGDHAAGYSKNSPIALSATSHYYFGTSLLAKAADFLGKEGDAQKYTELSQQIKQDFNNEFFKVEKAEYGTGSQFSNAVPLFMDLVAPENKDAVFENLLEDIEEKGFRLTTGDVGNRYLYQTLARNGANDVLFKMHNHYDTPGYGFQIKFGLTTLTEQWDPRKGNSLNHFMMGQIEEWFYRSLGGIVPDKENPGFKHFYLKPKMAGDLEFVNSSYESLYGKIISNWRAEEGEFSYEVEIPGNTTATLQLPEEVKEISINGKELEDSELTLELKEGVDFKLGSGKYLIKGKL